MEAQCRFLLENRIDDSPRMTLLKLPIRGLILSTSKVLLLNNEMLAPRLWSVRARPDRSILISVSGDWIIYSVSDNNKFTMKPPFRPFVVATLPPCIRTMRDWKMFRFWKCESACFHRVFKMAKRCS